MTASPFLFAFLAGSYLEDFGLGEDAHFYYVTTRSINAENED